MISFFLSRITCFDIFWYIYIYIIYIILYILYYIIYIILYILCIHIYIYNIYIYITYIYIYIHLKLKKQKNFLGKFSPYEISCGESGDEMSLVKPEFSKLVMEIIFFNVYSMNRLTK